MNQLIKLPYCTPAGNKLFNKLKLRELSEKPEDCGGANLAFLHFHATYFNLTPAKLSTYESNS